MTFGTWLFTKMRGELVGTDGEGNRYYQDKRMITGRRRKRWVIYKGEPEASRVPPEWHGWLHYTVDAPPSEADTRQSWQKEHVPNLSGTPMAYWPAGHALSSSGDKPKPNYEAWRPS
jgi:NADH:ubiquinone oxidoreductase subunit